MTTKLIELQDGTLVEVDVLGNDVQQISGGMADKVSSTLNEIKPILVNVCEPIAAAWNELNQKTKIEQAEVEIGISYEGEGNIYITKLKSGANLTVKLLLKPRPNEP